jgi:UTP--glucose-1-phosphate uridylyltransferase
VQNKEPKITVDERRPGRVADEPDLEWCPPGHGDVYTALQTSGTLEALLDAGYEYAFLSNSDNLGAVLDPRVLSWFAAEGLPFVMEVCEKTPADRKGGHPAVLKETGLLVLRETAQTPEEDLEKFGDIDTWKYFNTNNLWVNLRALAKVLDDNDGVLGLPMIVNKKTGRPGRQVDARGLPARDRDGRGGRRLRGREDAERAAAAVRAGQDHERSARAALRRLRAHRRLPRRAVTRPADGLPLVELDSDHFKLLRDFDARFPAGPPSLVGAKKLAVEGDVKFGRDVVVRGEASVSNDGDEQLVVDDGAVLEG